MNVTQTGDFDDYEAPILFNIWSNNAKTSVITLWLLILIPEFMRNDFCLFFTFGEHNHHLIIAKFGWTD